MTDFRRRLERTIARNPGIHFNGLVRRLDAATGQVQFHLHGLLGEGTIVRHEFYGRTHYFPATVEASERGALALLRRETARDVLLVLLDEGSARPAAVTETLDIARSTLEWHLDHLVEQGLVTKRHDDQHRVRLEPVEPAETTRLLAAVEPTLSDRMIDRFTRLVDRFLED